MRSSTSGNCSPRRRHAQRGAGLVALAAILSACTAGPDFSPPAPPAVASYVAGGDGLDTTAQRIVAGRPIGEQWWRAFGSAPLDALMQTAFADNRTLAAARASLAAAREQQRAAAGALWPQLSLGGTTGRQKYGVSLFGPSHFVIPPFTYYTAGPQVSYVLDLAGAERRTVEQRRALAQLRSYELRAVRLALAGNVLAQALAIASANTQLQVLDRIVANDRRNLALVDAARAAGSAAITDVVSAQSQLAHDATLLPPLQQQRSVAAHALAVLAGAAPAQRPAPDLRLTDWRLPAVLPLLLPSALLRARPDILAAESALHAASAAIGIATAGLYPQITLSANTTQQALSPGNLFNGAANAWAMAAGLTAPLFDGGTLRARRRAAIDLYRASLSDYRQTVLESFAQVADVLRALQHDDAEIRAERNAGKTAGHALALMRISYRDGATGVLNVLDAERQYNQARLQLVRAQARRFQDTALLYLALGGGSAAAAAPAKPAAAAAP
ncbi:MAG TPA: efflux transporter outer membrane subunit [Steroidobacteraceae bacterium]|nr:efflux transporter outer membrane subunit [Steroidobacteraceae bacterium]